MAIVKHTYIRQLLGACLIILMLVTTGCKQQTTPRPPLSADEVKTKSAEIQRISSANLDAWNKHDTDLMRPLLTNDLMYYEKGNSPDTTNSSHYISLVNSVFNTAPDYECRQLEIFIGREGGFDIQEIWNWMRSTKENPYLGYDRYVLKDGKISSMWLFWGSDVYERLFIPLFGATKVTFTQKPLQDYASAWSSGDPGTVASLYAPKVVRQDTLFNENQHGISAVKKFATNFFNWYPGVSFELLQSFKLGGSKPVNTGGVYTIHVSDQAGKPCDVKSIIVLELSQDKIINEWLFYNADSLIACGWAQ
jgi:hypothetical protein